MNRIGTLGLLAALALPVAAADKAKEDGPKIEKLTQAVPEIPKDAKWLGSKKPIQLKNFAGKVVLLHFWTTENGASNTNIGHYITWVKRYEEKGLAVVGVYVPPSSTRVSPEKLKEMNSTDRASLARDFTSFETRKYRVGKVTR